MEDLPLINAILKHIKNDKISFSMPGHLNGRGFNTKYGDFILSDPFKFDLTESEALDNLHNPKSSIKKALEKLRDYYGSYKSYFILNGSSCSNFIAGFSCFNEGDEVLIERSSHISIYNLMKIRRLKPVYFERELHKKYGIYLSINIDKLKKKIDEHPNLKGIFLTYPTYFGSISDIEEVISYAKSKNIYTIIDSAHGAHFGSHPLLPKHAVSLNADIISMSAHKTLPSMGQTAFLHLNNRSIEKMVDIYFNIFTTTSPSYLMMATLDYSRYFLKKDGYAYYDILIKRCKCLKDKINKTLHKIHVIDDDIDYKIDPTRINLFSEFIFGEELYRYLLDGGIIAEMSMGNACTLIMSPFNDEEEFEKLYLLLRAIDDKITNKSKIMTISIPEIPNLYCNISESLNKENEYVELDLSENKVCAKSILIYPPGTPIIVEGEIFTKKIINYIKDNKNRDIHGLTDGKVCIMKI